MKILLYNGNHKSTTFIQVLVNTIIKRKIGIIILGFDNSVMDYEVNGLMYSSIGSNQSKYIFILRSIIICIKSFFIHPVKAIQIIFTKEKYSNFREFILSKNIRHIIQIFQPDIIHIQWSSHVNLFRFLFNISNENRPKLIISLRGRLVNVSPITDPSINQLYLNYFPQIDGFHAVSHAISRKVQQWGVNDSRIKVIYSGLDINELGSSLKKNWNFENKIKILSVGRFHWIKGYHYALDALRLLLDRGLHIHYTIIAGQASEEILYQLNTPGLINHVSILPNLPHEKVFSHMQSADILLLPSVEEGIANVVLEAMAIGLPVVSSDCGGMAEVIEHEVNGVLFQNRNVAHMAAQLEKMINYSPEDRERMAMLARQRVTEQFGADRLGKEMAAFYEEVCKKN